MTGKRIGLFAGLALAALIQFIPVPDDLSREAWLLASIGVMMACWWATEALPIAATALVPLALFPFFGIATIGETASPYASPIVLLLLGGFIIALAVERWNLHARIALNVVNAFGGRPALLVAGFMAASALLSMWISNTATTIMMIPIALKVAESVAKEGKASPAFAAALALGVAYAASIGGTAVFVGTPTNLIAIGFLNREFDYVMDPLTWSAFALPVVLVFIPAAWFILTRFAFKLRTDVESRAAQATVKTELAALGRVSAPEARVAILFSCVAILWMGQAYLWNPLLAWISEAVGLPMTLSVSNTQIAFLGAVAAFLIPAGGNEGKGRMLMDWEATSRLPWNVVILFGGGLSLAAALSATGLAAWLGGQMSFLNGLPFPLLLLALILVIVFLTELTSNVATTTAFLPVLAAIAAGSGVPPQQLIVPIAIAASFAFMLPVATAPNAIVYASGEVTQRQMMKAGFRLNLAGAVILTVFAALLGPVVF
ncbi:SLC13 family permease [Hyphobacterium marinum]|uniref:DASS family sodium-coupled anion symporter n=1 Tax=Hyphobacterium marinum TaxID=3116574 RepID=A0ABU7LUG9_9PROT|nr:DASS family sodium-coupled anion symporter [Hyphobacterium sp. Y6023]MEE2565190.1 DASS family sodium-coupled anion symporter [Hyphobacterium sp. Y6023]